MISFSFNKLPGFSKLPAPLRKNPKLLLLIIVGLSTVLVFLVFLGSRETQKIKKSLQLVDTQKSQEQGENKDVGVLNPSLDTKSYVSRIEKQYYDIASKFDNLLGRIDTLEKNALELRKNQSEVSRIVMEFDKRVADSGKGTHLSEGAFDGRSSTVSPQPALNLETAKVGEISEEDNSVLKKYVYLPLGSFVKCTLLTGVYAPVNESNPLPVLISIDEAFYGPNNSRIPLKGAFAIGKAVGDIVSKRAIIQIVSFSTVLPNGRVFEHEANLGYLADDDGRLGIPGELIYNTGRQLGLDFLSGFLAGSSEALSQAETSTVVGAYGQTSRNVTGNSARYSMFSGLAKSAEGMSGYYQKQLEAMIPAIKIEAGKKVVFVIQKGVEIEGLEVTDDNFGFID